MRRLRPVEPGGGVRPRKRPDAGWLFARRLVQCLFASGSRFRWKGQQRRKRNATEGTCSRIDARCVGDRRPMEAIRRCSCVGVQASACSAREMPDKLKLGLQRFPVFWETTSTYLGSVVASQGTGGERANYLLRGAGAGLSCEHGLATGSLATDRCRYRGIFSPGAVSSPAIQPGTGDALRLRVAWRASLTWLDYFPRAQGRAAANHRQIRMTG